MAMTACTNQSSGVTIASTLRPPSGERAREDGDEKRVRVKFSDDPGWNTELNQQNCIRVVRTGKGNSWNSAQESDAADLPPAVFDLDRDKASSHDGEKLNVV